MPHRLADRDFTGPVQWQNSFLKWNRMRCLYIFVNFFVCIRTNKIFFFSSFSVFFLFVLFLLFFSFVNMPFLFSKIYLISLLSKRGINILPNYFFFCDVFLICKNAVLVFVDFLHLISLLSKRGINMLLIFFCTCCLMWMHSVKLNKYCCN